MPLLEGIVRIANNRYLQRTNGVLRESKEHVRLLEYEKKAVADLNTIGEGATGAQWAVSSSEEIAEALTQIHDNPSEWSQHAQTASQIVRDQFSWEQAAFTAINALRDRSFFKPQWIINL